MNEMYWLPFLILVAYLASGTNDARASVVVSPTIAGYSSAGTYRAAATTYSMMAANEGYIAQAVTNVGGRAVTIPAALRMAANAGQIAKGAMFSNPLLLVGTLALPWLIEHGLEYVNGQWVKTVPSTGGATSCTGNFNSYYYNGNESQVKAWLDANLSASYGSGHFDYGWNSGSPTSTASGKWIRDANGSFYGNYNCTGQPAPATQSPASQTDFDALPDPLPVIAPELPDAEYLPIGAPVTTPEYSPVDVPIGDPYTRPDGSTVQPRAKVTPAADGKVTIDTYDEPLTDQQGNPVSNPVPEDTQEPQPDLCEKYPNSIACAEFGSATPETVPTVELPLTPTITPVGGSGSCPADVTTTAFGLTWSYQPICDFASAVYPLVIGFAWLSFAYIVAGAIRQ